MLQGKEKSLKTIATSSLIRGDHNPDYLIERFEVEIKDKTKIIEELKEDSKKDMPIIKEHVERISELKSIIATLKKQRPTRRKPVGKKKK